MAATLQSVLGDGINLPHDLLPDDTKLLYWPSLGTVQEIDYDDPDDELLADWRDHDRYADIALACYNDKHDTDFKAVRVSEGRWCFHKSSGATIIIHCGFSAAQTTAAERESSFKNFFAVLEQAEPNGEVLVSSCCIADGLKTIGRQTCDHVMCKPCDSNWIDLKDDCFKSRFRKDDSSLSKCAHCLAEGVNLSEKARSRLPYPLLAMAYYNRKHRKNYKLVDAWPSCSSIESIFVTHCNFIARQNGLADDVSNKLFFAELEKRKGQWVVTACRILHGCKTAAGCHFCTGRQGKRVIHPTRGFRFGRRAPVYRSLRRRC